MGEAYKFTGAKLPARSLTFIGSLVQAIQLYGIFEDSSTLILFHNGSWIYFANRNTFGSPKKQFVAFSLRETFKLISRCGSLRMNSIRQIRLSQFINNLAKYRESRTAARSRCFAISPSKQSPRNYLFHRRSFFTDLQSDPLVHQQPSNFHTTPVDNTSL